MFVSANNSKDTRSLTVTPGMIERGIELVQQKLTPQGHLSRLTTWKTRNSKGYNVNSKWGIHYRVWTSWMFAVRKDLLNDAVQAVRDYRLVDPTMNLTGCLSAVAGNPNAVRSIATVAVLLDEAQARDGALLPLFSYAVDLAILHAVDETYVGFKGEALVKEELARLYPDYVWSYASQWLDQACGIDILGTYVGPEPDNNTPALGYQVKPTTWIEGHYRNDYLWTNRHKEHEKWARFTDKNPGTEVFVVDADKARLTPGWVLTDDQRIPASDFGCHQCQVKPSGLLAYLA